MKQIRVRHTLTGATGKVVDRDGDVARVLWDAGSIFPAPFGPTYCLFENLEIIKE